MNEFFGYMCAAVHKRTSMLTKMKSRLSFIAEIRLPKAPCDTGSSVSGMSAGIS